MLAVHGPSFSPVMAHTLKILATVSRLDVPVLLTGEAGSGKSWLAQALHAASSHRKGPFVAFDCLAMSEPASFARELSTTVKWARGGTLYVQEVEALPVQLQIALASLLERRRKGLAAPAYRIVASSRRDLESAVAAGAFNRELLDQLNGIEVSVAPLRERPEDVLPLAAPAPVGAPRTAR
jgi:DNA-binding NtrC family response regulator